MRFRVTKDGGAKPWALIVEEGDVQIEKRDFKTQGAAEKARETIFRQMRGEADAPDPTDDD